MLVLGGYGIPVGTTTPNSTSGPRVIARINAAGAVDTRTTVGAIADRLAMRSVATVDGSEFWSVHALVSDGNLFFTPYGGATAGVPLLATNVYR